MAPQLLVFAVALLGHIFFWVGVINLIHAVGLSSALTRGLTLLGHVCLWGVPAWLGWSLWQASGGQWAELLAVAGLGPRVYLLAACAAGVFDVPRWLWFRLTDRAPAAQLSNHTVAVNLAARLQPNDIGPLKTRLLARIPGNQALTIHCHEKVLELPRLPVALDGLSIAHLSDLHYTGALGKAFYEQVIELTNKLDADVVAVTGDIVDKRECLDWIPDTLGQLRSRHGSYFILGNHDLRVRDLARLRRTLTEAGLTDLGGRAMLLAINGADVLLAGDELPWIAPPDDAGATSICQADKSPLRILLAHTPDRYRWAQKLGFDLALAGHTHGGQIRIPLVGAVFVPSRFGPRYAAGTYDEPPTILHVTRGLAGVLPLRMNCPPELTKLILRSPQAKTQAADARR